MIPVPSLDAAMVVAETAEMPLHNLGIVMLDPPPEPAESPYDAMRTVLEARLPLAPAFRRRLVRGPLGDLHWIEDPAFDLGRHLLRATLPAPGGPAELAAFVGEYAGRLLDREKPLWEFVLVEGLASGELAAVAKIHHAAMDGSRIAALLDRLFDRSPRAPVDAPPDPWRPEPRPRALRLAVASAGTLADQPRKVARSIVRIGGAVRRSTRSSARQLREGRPAGRERHGDGRFDVPKAPWNGSLSTHRSAAFSDVPVADLRAICAAFGTTINDVVLAASTASLRAWLLARNALPDRPLVAAVPIAVRHDGAHDGEANRISMVRVHLPVREPDPVARLLQIHTEMLGQKRQHHSRGASVFNEFADLALNLSVPSVLSRAIGLYSSHHGADFHPPPWSLVISNIAGPAHELFWAGAKVTRIYPYGPVQHGSGLNLTVMTVGDRLCLGALACRERVPHVDDVTRGFADEVSALRELARSRG